MIRRPSQIAKQLAQLSPEQMRLGIDRLTKLVDRVRLFNPQTIIDQYNIPQVDQLSAAIEEALARTFGPGTMDYERYRHAKDFDNGPHNYAYKVPIADVHRSLERSKQSNIALLEQAIETLKERLAETGSDENGKWQVVTTQDGRELVFPASMRPVANHLSRKAFVVHGHNDGAREAVARFLEKLGFEAVILHKKANQGRTVIEKVEAHSDVGFAVVLLSPDDEGAVKGGTPQPRAC
jgi:CAP12/Pycsar effector protein, TIR domain